MDVYDNIFECYLDLYANSSLSGWFQGLSSQFLSVSVPKVLILAGKCSTSYCVMSLCSITGCVFTTITHLLLDQYAINKNEFV